jgi:glucoamylase
VLSCANNSDWYTWTRDAALTFKVLIERFIAGDTPLQDTIDDYVAAQAILQNVTNPSGTPESGGLGEPKFHVDLTAFTGSWCRPQRDGPPLRATALTLYANWLIQNGQTAKATEQVWPVIEKDLAYTVSYWNRTGYDLWEEVNGSSFFTLSATHRALVEGSALAKSLSQTCTNCAEYALRVLCFVQSFWVGGYIDSNINTNDGRTGKDANSLLSSIHTFDPTSECTDATFQPCSPRALANLLEVVESFRNVYQINSNRGPNAALAVGRYSEDVYYDGNPWYLTTLAAAEQLYAALYQWNRIGALTINSVSLPLFQHLVPSATAGTYAKDSATYVSLTKAVKVYADGFVYVVREYTPADGSLAEQYTKANGTPISARDLTWSYAAFLSAAERRAGIVPPSWGETGANTVPDVCQPAPACDSDMTVNVKATTVPGEAIFVVGSITELSNWDPNSAVPLNADKYTQDNPLWTTTIKIPASSNFEYKYIRKQNGQITWESDPNRSASSTKECGSAGTLNDVWR